MCTHTRTPTYMRICEPVRGSDKLPRPLAAVATAAAAADTTATADPTAACVQVLFGLVTVVAGLFIFIEGVKLGLVSWCEEWPAPMATACTPMSQR